MRIAYLSDELNVHDRRFLEKLGRSGRRTTLVTFYNRDASLPAWIAGVSGIDVVHHRLKVYPDGGARGPALLRRWRFDRDVARAVDALRDDLRRLAPDVLHAGWVQTCGLLAARSGFHPMLLMPWGSDILYWPERSRRDRARAAEALRAADAVTCDAEHVKERIRAIVPYPPERIVVFPWGIDLERFQPARRDPALRAREAGRDAVVLIATRKLAPIYGTDVLLRALALAEMGSIVLCLWIVGDGPEGARLRALAGELGIQDRVRFLGAVDNEALPAYLASADVYVSASHSDGASLSLLEAMACGLPAAVTDCPAILEWVQDGVNGRIARRGDAAGMAEALGALARDAGLRRRMGEANLAVARARADWNRNFETLLRLYDSLVKAR